MVKVDLITGFLGSGKTTFIRKYIHYLQKQNEKIGILENDYGAINVDMMLLQDLKNVGLEMVAGGCDYDCHVRRFRTKLITMAMLGYKRIIVEPSGIFDVDEFYDVLNEDQMRDLFEIDNVLAIVSANQSSLSKEADGLFASQIATAGRIILSFSEYFNEDTITYINESLKSIHCNRTFSLEKNIICKNWDELNDDDFSLICQSGYVECGYIKRFSMDENNFDSLFYMNCSLNKEQLLSNIKKVFDEKDIGVIHRIKGFVKEDDHWIELNATKESIHSSFIHLGQNIIIVIGENLDKEKIESFFPSEFSTYNVELTAQSIK